MVFWGSPTGAQSVEITWLKRGAGAFGRDKKVPPAEATHARIIEGGGSQAGERQVSLSEANEYARRLQLYADQQAAEGVTREIERERWLDGLSSTCPHCLGPRAYAGLEQLQEGSRSSVMFLGEGWAMSNVDVHVYQCLFCGSIELFRDGPIEHPLRGNLEA